MSNIRDILYGIISNPRLEREVAFLVDIIMCAALAVFPNTIGYVIAATYFLLRDNPILFGGQSFGKRIFGLRVRYKQTNSVASWRATFLRNLLIMVPILNLIDAYKFVVNGQRLVDEWLSVEVTNTNNETISQE